MFFVLFLSIFLSFQNNVYANLIKIAEKHPALTISNNELTFGNKKASVQVVEYADFGCHHCMDFFDKEFDNFYDKYIKTGKVYFAFRPLVLSQQSLKMSMFLMCQKRDTQNDIKLMKLFFNNMHLLGSVDYAITLEKILKNAKINTENYYKCINSKEFEKTVLQTRQIAIKELKIPGVPFIFVNGREVPVDATLFRIIDGEIARKAN